MRFYRIIVTQAAGCAGWRLVNSTLDRCNRRKTVGSTVLLSSFEHFRRLLHALGAMVCGMARRPPIELCRLHTRCAKNKPLGTVVFRYSRINDLTNRDNAPHVPVPVYVYRFGTWYTRPVLRWRTGSNAPCTVRGIKASISKNTSAPLFVFPPKGGLRKKLFCYLACSDWYSICCMCISWSDIYFGNTFGSILMHTLFPWVNIEQYSSCYTRYLFNIFFTLGNESLARSQLRVSGGIEKMIFISLFFAVVLDRLCDYERELSCYYTAPYSLPAMRKFLV